MKTTVSFVMTKESKVLNTNSLLFQDQIGLVTINLHLTYLDIGQPAQLVRVDINHTATRDGSRRSDGQIGHLKEHVHVGCQLDSLRVGQAEHLVVIQHSVHVFYPQSIHRTIANNPLVVGARILRVSR